MTGIVGALPEEIRVEALDDLMVAEAIKTSEIEGQYLSRNDVMSSIKNNLGLNRTIEPVKDKGAEGIGQLMIDVRDTYQEPLTDQKLFQWHQLLFPEPKAVKAGAWRNHQEQMPVVSGAMGREKFMLKRHHR